MLGSPFLRPRVLLYLPFAQISIQKATQRTYNESYTTKAKNSELATSRALRKDDGKQPKQDDGKQAQEKTDGKPHQRLEPQ
jgi:hypothetical protein